MGDAARGLVVGTATLAWRANGLLGRSGFHPLAPSPDRAAHTIARAFRTLADVRGLWRAAVRFSVSLASGARSWATGTWHALREGTPRERGRAIGSLAFDVATLFVPVTKAGAIGALHARLARATSNLSRAGARYEAAVLARRPIRSVGRNLNEGSGALNDVFLAHDVDGTAIVVRSPKLLRNGRRLGWAMRRMDRGAIGAAHLAEYGGPRYLGKVRIPDGRGGWRAGQAFDLVPGSDALVIEKRLAEPTQRVWITGEHIRSAEQLIDRLRREGNTLRDAQLGNFMLTPDGRVVPIDMDVMPGSLMTKSRIRHYRPAELADDLRRLQREQRRLHPEHSLD